MQPKISEADFAALVRRAGLELSAAQFAELHQAYAYIEGFIERVHGPRGREAEPAMTFRPDVG